MPKRKTTTLSLAIVCFTLLGVDREFEHYPTLVIFRVI